jgi:cell division protein FtsQ
VLKWFVRCGAAAAVVFAAMWALQAGYDYATTSPRFEARALIFEPTPHVGDERLRELLGLVPGTNVLSLNPEELAERIEADPWVKSASVARVLPDALEVRIEEHEAYAVTLFAGRFALVDATGTPFKMLSAGERGELPVITGLADSESNPAKVRRHLERAIEVLATYGQKTRPRLGEVNLGKTGAVTLFTAELGTQLRLGRSNISRSLARYDALRAALGDDSDKLSVVHLDCDTPAGEHDRIFVRFFEATDPPALIAQSVAHLQEQMQSDTQRGEASQTVRDRRASQRLRLRRIPRYD